MNVRLSPAITGVALSRSCITVTLKMSPRPKHAKLTYLVHLSKFSSVKLELKWIGNTELKLTTYKLIIARTKNQRSVDTFFEAHLSFRAESQ